MSLSYVEDYGLDAPSRRWSLLVLTIDNDLPCKCMDILHLQKVIRYFEYLRNTQELDYSDFKLGAVSYELKENLEELVSSGLIGKTDGNYTLTPKGKEIADSLLKTFDPMEHQKLIFAKQQLNDLPSEEVLYFMYKLIPSTQRNSTEIVRLEKKKNTLIRRLFLKGRINSTTAAKWLEMSEKDFLDSLPTSR